LDSGHPEQAAEGFGGSCEYGLHRGRITGRLKTEVMPVRRTAIRPPEQSGVRHEGGG